MNVIRLYDSGAPAVMAHQMADADVVVDHCGSIEHTQYRRSDFDHENEMIAAIASELNIEPSLLFVEAGWPERA